MPPDPVIAFPDTWIHETFDVARQEQPVIVLTVIVPLPPAASNCAALDARSNVQGRPLCVTVVR